MKGCDRCAAYSDLSEYFNNQAFSDVRLYTKSRTFHASSVILSLHSPVFRKIIEEDNEKDIFLDSFLDEEDEMEMIVSSLYRRDNLAVSVDLLFTVAKFGVTYEVTWITRESLEFVRGNISHGNCILIARAGHQLKEYFRYPAIADVCDEFLRRTTFLEEIVEQLETITDDDYYLSIPASFFHNLLQNCLRRDEKRVIDLIQRWFKRDSNVIQAMAILPLLQLSQLYLVNGDLHTSFFEFLISSEKLTSEDKRTILELSARSIEGSRNCMVTGVGFSKEVPKEMQGSRNVKDFLQSPTWKSCSFDDIVMVKQFRGINEFIHLELFLVWSTSNVVTEYQVKAILSSIDLTRINKEYIDDLIANLKLWTNPILTDNFSGDLETRAAAHDFSRNPGIIREFAKQNLKAGHIKSLKLKKHTLTTRPCSVPHCWERTLAFVDIKLKRDSFPFFKVGRLNLAPTMLEHSHNGSVLHVYFVVEGQIVTCYCESWNVLEEMLRPDEKGSVTIKVICIAS